MRIGIDIDDTVFDFVSVWIDEYNKDHEDQLTLEDITDWVFSGVDFKCTKAEFYNYLHNAYLQLQAKPMPYAVEGLECLTERGHLACFITATRRSVAPTKINKLLMELGPDMPYELHFTSEKEYIMCDAYIDDNPKDVEAYLKSRGRLVMLFDRPWNRHVSANSLVTLIRRIQCVQHENYQHRTLERLELCQRPIRVTNWDEIVMAIQWFDELLRQEVE